MPSSYADDSTAAPPNPTAVPEIILDAAGQQPDQPFGKVLEAKDLEELCQKHGVTFGLLRHCIYNPFLTLWAFLSQCLCQSKSQCAAVTRVVVLRVLCFLPSCSHATGGYSQALHKLPPLFIRDLAYRAGERLEQQAPQSWRWKDRRVAVADGTTMSGPDTPENQKAYPQSKSQKKGLGFPLIRLVVLLGLATAGVIGAAFAPWAGVNNGEVSLLRMLYERLQAGDVLLADAGFCSYWGLVMPWLRGVDVVVRLKEASWSMAAVGKKLGAGDYEVVWTKPKTCPKWMDAETYQNLPETLTLREVHTTVSKRGFRTQKVIIITTLLDVELYPAADIRQLYRDRWHVELDIRAIKTWMGMAVLRGQTPEALEREIWGHLLAYNLVRRLQAQAAVAGKCKPRQLSFTAARDQLAENWTVMASADDALHAQLAEAAVQGVVSRKVGNRPDRYEPRRLKRRPKDCKLLTKPRAQAREDVAAGLETRVSKRPKKRKGKAAAAATGEKG